jgi:transcriptional regulator CtsR
MDEIEEYLAQLTEQERVVLEIAKAHLGSSFDISKSIGFLEWKKKYLYNI